MLFSPFSKKQTIALSWWCDSSTHIGRDAIICDGAVRSGKTLCLSLSFVAWAMARFSGESFGLCGKTVKSLRRNLLTPLLAALNELDFECEYKISQETLNIVFNGRQNRFYLFGGKDEGSAALIQGVTLAGVLFDEVALMPRSFVEQALARCSVNGSKLWFNCNPEHPRHWFYSEWISKADGKNALYLHFKMEDNPSLSPKVLARYRAQYSGAFFERYVLGKWVAAEGAVYPMFSEKKHVFARPPQLTRYVISCDYGTVNPASFGLWGEHGGCWYRLREHYHSGRRTGVQKTDEEYADALEALAGGRIIEAVVVDPSAASFMACLRRRGGWNVVPAKNDVADGIRTVAAALHAGKIKIHKSCADTLREFALYRWNLNAAGDAPVKENDHAMDDIRYFAGYAFGEASGGFAAIAVKR
jgi:PBSX family phage terminase large subunit